MDGNQIKIFINLEIIGEGDKTKKNYKMIMKWQVFEKSTKSQRSQLYTYIDDCKDQIWLESKTGMDPGPRSPNNEFIECRKEN